MDDLTTASFIDLLRSQPLAALATLHRGEPATSMVPLAWLPSPGGARGVIHVSRLATHTGDMQAHPGVSLLLMGQPAEGEPLQACARVSLQARAQVLAADDPAHAAARAAYLNRFPDAALMFELGDFSLYTLDITSARFVAGFGRAHSVVGEALQATLAQAASP